MTDDRAGLAMTARALRFAELAWANGCEKDRVEFIAKWGPLPPRFPRGRLFNRGTIRQPFGQNFQNNYS